MQLIMAVCTFLGLLGTAQSCSELLGPAPPRAVTSLGRIRGCRWSGRPLLACARDTSDLASHYQPPTPPSSPIQTDVYSGTRYHMRYMSQATVLMLRFAASADYRG